MSNVRGPALPKLRDQKVLFFFRTLQFDDKHVRLVCLDSAMAAPIPYLGFRFLLLGSILMANAFFAASEVALLSVRESRLRQLAEEGQAGARVALALLANPERLLSVTQVGVTLASLGLGWAGEDTVYQLFLTMFHPVMTPALSV